MSIPVPESVATLLADILFSVVFLKGLVLAFAAVALGTGMRRASAAGRAAVWTAALFGLVALSGTAVPWFWKTGIPQVWTVELAQFPQQLYDRRLPGLTLGGVQAPVAAWLGLVWAAGAAVMMARFGAGLVRIAGITRRARAVRDTAIRATVSRALPAGRSRASLRVLLTDELRVPVTWGLLRPVILLPVAARGWSEDLLNAVLRHEAAHVARRDYLTLVALEAARALHWPNPLVWYLVRRARLDQERACDDAALGQGVTPVEYARHLVSVARTAIAPSASPAALAMIQRSLLRDRVRDVMRPDADRRPASRRTVATACAVVAVVAVQVSLSNLWACPTGDAAVAQDAASHPITNS